MTRVRSFHRCLHNATAWITLLVVFALSSLFGGTIGCVPDNGTLSTLSNGDESTDATDDGSVDTNNEITDDEVNVADLTTAEVEVSSDFSGSDTGDSGDTVLISEQEAMEIAIEDLDPRFYEAMSTIIGPMEWDTDVITAYEVTVTSSDHFLLRYIDAVTGVFLYDEVHDLPGSDETVVPTGEDGASSTDSAERAYYTSCPAGWPLCIQNPATITFYSQNDPNWSGQVLGNGPGNYTIGNSGCLISSYGMALKQRGHGNTTPAVLNTKKQCFNGPLVVSSCMAGQFGASYATIGVNQVWSHIASGIPVTVYGYSPCMGSNHAQMIWGHNGSQYWTKDPWYNWTNQDRAMCVNNPSYRVMY